MAARNRGNYSGYGDRRAGGMNILRQGVLFLTLGALSFLLGFFVLARLAPIGHGPDMPGGNAFVPPVSARDNAVASSARPAYSERATLSRPAPTVPPPNVVHPLTATPPAGPSIEPADDGKTQAPSPLDDRESPAPSRGAAADTNSAPADTNSAPAGGKPADAAVSAPVVPTHRRRRLHRRTRPAERPSPAPTTQEQQPANMDDGTQPAGQPDSPAKDNGNTQGAAGSQGGNDGDP